VGENAADDEDPTDPETPVDTVEGERAPRQFGPTPGAVGPHPRWLPGQDVRHDELGPGWVQGSGVGRVTVRLEAPGGEPGRIRTFRADDAELHAVDSAEVAREALASWPEVTGD
jgi:DNA polymerase-4